MNYQDLALPELTKLAVTLGYVRSTNGVWVLWEAEAHGRVLIWSRDGTDWTCALPLGQFDCGNELVALHSLLGLAEAHGRAASYERGLRDARAQIIGQLRTSVAEVTSDDPPALVHGAAAILRIANQLEQEM